MRGARLQSRLARLLLVTAAIPVLATGFAGDAAARKLKHPANAPPAATLAVPLPRARPQGDAVAAAGATTATAAAAPDTDTIGAIISDGSDPEMSAREDSDAPEATPAPQADTTAPAPAGKALNPVGLKLAIQFLDNNNPAGAMLAAYALPDRLDVKITNWMVATGNYTSIPATTLADLDRKLQGWPQQALMRLRYEQALVRGQAAPQQAIKELGAGKPVSDEGTLYLAAAYRATGRSDDAAALIRAYWRDDDFPAAIEDKIVQSFADLLRPADHAARMDRLLYAGDAAGALRTAKLLDRNQQALAKAVSLVIKGSPKASAALTALPAAVKNDPLVLYSRVQILRRQNKSAEAGQLLASAPQDPKLLVAPDAWWVERRLVSRQLIDAGNARLAYVIAAGHAGESPAMQAEAEFHAGWYALEYLHEPGKAQSHFAAVAAISKLPLSLSRAEYWLGRTAEAANDAATAKAHYQRAAAYPTTFYGELALARLGNRRLSIALPPTPGPDTIQTFSARELVQAVQHLAAAGYGDRAAPFFRTLGDTLDDPGELALLTAMADRDGNHQLALQIGKSAVSRGLPCDALAFPTTAIPSSAKISGIERPVVFAIARQESAFNPQAISRAGARGLLQLMPATARQVAKASGVPYSRDRLTADPGYNAELGAAHLSDLVGNFGGSYVMTFAAYNAGATRVAEWVKQHGDPRDPRVDVVNWIERIPFTETRNYVQRIMENLQVYRVRFGQPALTIDADLRRGGSAGQ